MTIDPVTELSNAMDLGKPWDGPMTPQVGLGRRPRCTKIQHATKKLAREAVNRALARHRNRPDDPLKTYFCKECKAWHLARVKRKTP